MSSFDHTTKEMGSAWPQGVTLPEDDHRALSLKGKAPVSVSEALVPALHLAAGSHGLARASAWMHWAFHCSSIAARSFEKAGAIWIKIVLAGIAG